GSLEAAARLVGFRFDAGALDVDGAQALACLGRGATCIDFLGAEPAQLFSERSGSRRARVGACAQRRLEAIVSDSFERLDELRGQSCERNRERIARGGVGV